MGTITSLPYTEIEFLSQSDKFDIIPEIRSPNSTIKLRPEIILVVCRSYTVSAVGPEKEDADR